jgi:hypothetical protein
MYNACQGDDGMKEYNARPTRKMGAKPTGAPSSLRDRFRIYFPTDRTVRESRGGYLAGGTICVQNKWWQAPTFPRELVRDCVNTRKGLLMHSKIIFVRKTNKKVGNTARAWAYVGSANLSESAWGRIVKDRALKTAKMSCRNWECGVVIPMARLEDGKADEGESMGVFSSKMPVPMQTPGPPYAPSDKPWLYLGA